MKKIIFKISIILAIISFSGPVFADWHEIARKSAAATNFGVVGRSNGVSVKKVVQPSARVRHIQFARPAINQRRLTVPKIIAPRLEIKRIAPVRITPQRIEHPRAIIKEEIKAQPIIVERIEAPKITAPKVIE